MRGRPRLPLRSPLPREALPLALLLLALAPVFVFGHDRSQSYRANTHGTSLPTLTIAANLSAEHRFLLFEQQKLDPNGEPEYVPYARFPIGSYALVRLAIQPFGDDFPRAIRAARLAMLACFAAAAVLAYLALARLLGDRRIALAATLLAFSSYYLLYYNDMVSAEASTNLFGVMLVFHGMALYVQEGRFRQLLARTAIAILLGWHVVALIAPFVLLALGREILESRADGGGARPSRVERRLRPRGILAYGAFSALCAVLVLGFNFGNEYLAFGGETPLRELPSVRSLLARSGIGDARGNLAGAPSSAPFGMDWWTFLQWNLGSIGGTAIPFAAADRLGLDLHWGQFWPNPWLAAPGAAVLAACAAGLRWLPQRTLFASLLATGWIWAILFRGNIVHEWETMFHLGAPLVFWTLALLGLSRLSGRRAALALPAAALAAAAVFALSAAAMGRLGHNAEAAAFQREATSDFHAMRPLATGRTVLFAPIAAPAGIKHVRYWLHGSYLEPNDIGTEREWDAAASRHDFVVLPVDLGGSLTPHNRRFHLYTPAALDGARASITAGEPDARSAFEVRLDGRTLLYTRDGCAPDDMWPSLFVHAVPLDANDLPPDRRAAGFEDRAHYIPYRGVRFGGRCIARIELPDYPLAGVRTGQRHGGLPALWEASLPAGDASFPRGASAWRDAVPAPALASAFEVSLDGRTLLYVRDGCAEEDTEARFFVHVLPLDAGDLPEERRRYGSERHTFAFAERGVRYEGACLAAFELPDYPILGVRTGQYSEDGEVWAGEFPLDPGAWLARFEALAASEPAVSSAFGVYLEGRTLHYLREECADADAGARFFLHVAPLDAGDLPEERRAPGFDNLDFVFGDRGLRYGGRCLASIALPEYGVASVRTGQFAPGGEIWAGEVSLAP